MGIPKTAAVYSPVSSKLLEAGGTLFKTSRKEVRIVSVDTMLQAVAAGLMIMTAVYGNKKNGR